MHPFLVAIFNLLLSFLRSKWHILAAAALYYYIFGRVYDYWFTFVGSGAWAPAWPKPRTYYVILLGTTAIWCGCMATSMVLFDILVWVWRRGTRQWYQRRGYRAAFDYEQLPQPESDGVVLTPMREANLELDTSHDSLEDREQRWRTRRSGSDTSRRHGVLKRHSIRWWLWFGMFISGAVTGAYQRYHYEQPNDYRFKAEVHRAIREPKAEGYGNKERIFIAAMFHNNEKIIPYWHKEIVRTIHYLGLKNVYVSVIESYSGDGTADRLREMETELNALGVENRFLLGDTSITRPPSMESAPPRIEFLSATRNLALKPMIEKGNFDRLIFSNDVYIEAESIVELLNSRDGDWDMVCGIDMSFWGLYDAWVARDRLGRLVSSLWPYFLEDAGFKAVMKEEPAPAFACWNGIVAVRAEPFYPPDKRRPGKLSTKIPPHPIPSTHPEYPKHANTTPADMPALEFRKSIDGECFSSESFLLPYDLRRQFDMQNIFMNTRVINSYDWNFYVWYKYVLRHPWVKWWIEKVENGNGIHLAKMVIGNGENVWNWDGGECQPWY